MIALPLHKIGKYSEQLYVSDLRAHFLITFTPGCLFKRFFPFHPTAGHEPAILINMPDKQNFSILNQHNAYTQIDGTYDKLINFAEPIQYSQNKGHECPKTGCGLYGSSSFFISSSESLISRAAIA